MVDILTAKQRMDDCVEQYKTVVDNNPDSIESLSLRAYYVEHAAETYLQDLNDLKNTFGETETMVRERERAYRIYRIVANTKSTVLAAYKDLAAL